MLGIMAVMDQKDFYTLVVGPGRRGRYSGTSWRISVSLHHWCGFLIFLCRRWLRTFQTPCGSWISRLPSTLSKCPRSLALHVLLVLFFLSRSQRNSQWKCRLSCLLCGSRSRSSTLLFVVVVVKVPSQDRVQQRRLLLWNAFLSGLWSRSSTFLLLVLALGRGLPHLLVLQMKIFTGVFALFPTEQSAECRAGQCGPAPARQLVDSGGLWAAQGVR